jgi:glycosyltransferase involved in cell wall biosynthesis
MQNPPPAVVENIRNKETVLFVGSGFSVSAGFPSSASIASLLSRKLRIDGKIVDPSIGGQLDRVAELFETTYGRGRLVSEVESFLRTSPRDALSPSHRLLASLVKHGFVKTIVTTNYDTLIEDACAVMGAPIRVVAHESQLFSAAGDQPVLYKIHGDFSHPALLVLSPADLQSWRLRPEARPIVAQMQAVFDRNALLFLGYSLSDFNILALLLGSDFSTRGSPRHKRFAAVYSERSLDDAAARFRQYEVEAFHCADTEALLRSLLLRLPVKLRVKHLVFNYPSWYPDQEARYGGIETFIRYLQDHSSDCAHQTFQALFGGMLKFEPSQLGNTAYPTYPASYFFFRAAAEAALETTLHERSLGGGSLPDVIHVHFLEFAPMCEDADFPTLCTSHSLLSLDLAFTKGLFDGHGSPGARQEVLAAYAAERAAASAARFVTVLSSAHEEEVRRLGARSVRRLDPPFDPSQFRVERDPRTARQRAGLADKLTITYVGRPDRRKGIEVLIRACEQLAESGQDFQLLLVGYGFSHWAGRLAFGTGWYWFDTSRLHHRGIRVELREASNSLSAGLFYSSSDIVVVPSLYEPMGYVVLEAMACARPVVAARIGGIVETIIDGSNGMLFEPGDADDLAGKLVTLSREPDRRQRLAEQARRDVEKRRPVQDVVREWEQLYRQVAFSFGESLYPSPDLLEVIRSRCERISGRDIGALHEPISASVGVYEAAVLGCNLIREIMGQQGTELSLPQGVPVDRPLLRAIATELQRALRRKGVAASFSVAALSEVMSDLALAVLNREQDQPGLCLQADETKKRLQDSWFQKVVGCVVTTP